jgi:hypothetical protein
VHNLHDRANNLIADVFSRADLAQLRYMPPQEIVAPDRGQPEIQTLME